MVISNSALGGGGSYGGSLTNCLLAGNTALTNGGAFNCILADCTIAGNLATNSVGGVAGALLTNCVIYSNTAPTNANYGPGIGQSLSSFYFCCTTPLPTNGPGIVTGLGNITNAPLFVNFVGGNFRLQSNSYCINSGTNAVPAGPDLDGNPRIVGGTVDIGAYEFQNPASIISRAWLEQYGFPTDGSADFLDPDGDGMNNWQEWRAGTDPTNAASVLLVLNPVNSFGHVVVTWQSVTNHLYYIQKLNSLSATPVFQPLGTNLVGHAGTTSYTDTAVTGNGPYYYRVGVQ